MFPAGKRGPGKGVRVKEKGSKKEKGQEKGSSRKRKEKGSGLATEHSNAWLTRWPMRRRGRWTNSCVCWKPVGILAAIAFRRTRRWAPEASPLFWGSRGLFTRCAAFALHPGPEVAAHQRRQGAGASGRSGWPLRFARWCRSADRCCRARQTETTIPGSHGLDGWWGGELFVAHWGVPPGWGSDLAEFNKGGVASLHAPCPRTGSQVQVPA
jgi:hypothetical protein